VKTEISAGERSVRVDHLRCSGTAYCHDALPQLFTVEDKRAWLRADYDLASADMEVVEEAAASCPWFAITVDDT
jgi:ferredoxin